MTAQAQLEAEIEAALTALNWAMSVVTVIALGHMLAVVQASDWVIGPMTRAALIANAEIGVAA